jgi:hypothetical protein
VLVERWNTIPVIELAGVRTDSSETAYELPKQLRTGTSQHVGLADSRHCLPDGEQLPV